MGWRNWSKKGSFLDLDYIYGTLSAADGEDPLDYPALLNSPMKLLMVRHGAGSPGIFPRRLSARTTTAY